MDGNRERTLVIVEPSLLKTSGHSLEGAARFAKFALSLGFKVHLIAPTGAPSLDAQSGCQSVIQHQILPRAYARFLALPFSQNKMSHMMEVLSSKIRIGNAVRDTFKKAALGLWFIENYLASRRAFKLFTRKMAEEHEANEITYFFPSADNLMARALTRELRKQNSSSKVLLRFIGVFEHIGIPKLMESRALFKVSARRSNVRIFAETTPMRDYISSFGANCSVLEYPSFSVDSHEDSRKESHTNLFLDDDLVIGFLGNGRDDQGSIKALDIAIACNSLGYKFLVQNDDLLGNDQRSNFTRNLLALPNVFPIGANLDRKTFSEVIRSCDILVLPYDIDTYRFRGSAMLFEAADMLKPIIAPKGTGLGETVEEYGLGVTYSQDLPWIEVLARAKNFRNRIDAIASYNDIRNKRLERALTER